jgi:hypothetical protein
MPASLFAAWAGQHASVEYGVTAATRVTGKTKTKSAVALTGLVQLCASSQGYDISVAVAAGNRGSPGMDGTVTAKTPVGSKQ